METKLMHFSLQHGAPPKLHLQVGEAVLNSTSKAYPEEEEGVKAEVKTPLRLELTNAKKNLPDIRANP